MVLFLSCRLCLPPVLSLQRKGVWGRGGGAAFDWKIEETSKVGLRLGQAFSFTGVIFFHISESKSFVATIQFEFDQLKSSKIGLPCMYLRICSILYVLH